MYRKTMKKRQLSGQHYLLVIIKTWTTVKTSHRELRQLVNLSSRLKLAQGNNVWFHFLIILFLSSGSTMIPVRIKCLMTMNHLRSVFLFVLKPSCLHLYGFLSWSAKLPESVVKCFNTMYIWDVLQFAWGFWAGQVDGFLPSRSNTDQQVFVMYLSCHIY